MTLVVRGGCVLEDWTVAAAADDDEDADAVDDDSVTLEEELSDIWLLEVGAGVV